MEKPNGKNVTIEEKKMIPYNMITPNPLNDFPMEDIEELAASIAVDGLLTSLTAVGPYNDGTYVLISGHRRFKAIQTLVEKSKDMAERFREIPVIVVGGSDTSPTKQRYLIEVANVQVRDINKNEHIFKMLGLLKNLNESPDEKESSDANAIMDAFKISNRYARMYTNIFDKDDTGELQKRVIDKEIGVSDAAAIVNFDEEERKEAIEELKRGTKSKDIIEKKRKGDFKGKKEFDLDEVDRTIEEVGFDKFFEDTFGDTMEDMTRNLSVDSTGRIKELLADNNGGGSGAKISASERRSQRLTTAIDEVRKLTNKDEAEDFDQYEQELLTAIEECYEKFH